MSLLKDTSPDKEVKEMKNKINEIVNKDNSIKCRLLKLIEKYSLIFLLLLSLMLNFFIEAISRHSLDLAYIFATDRWKVFVYNSYLIFTSLTLTYLFRKRIFVTMMISGLWLMGGIANGAVLSYRVTPFTGQDMKLIKSAFSLINKYMSIPQMILTFVIAICVVLILITAGISAPKYKGKMKYRKSVIMSVLFFASIIPVTKLNVEARVLSTYFGNITIAYEDYGFPYCFFSTVLNTGIACPNEYSKETVDEILRQHGENKYDTENTPNIIFLQLESFFDPARVKYLEFSEDPIPNFRSLKKNFSSGYLTVPSVGAGTANTEFEVITGMSMRYFGPGEYPYKTILKEMVCESVAFNLKGIGYSTHAIHNNEANFYGRRNVFANLGFDTFTSEEYMNIKEVTPLGWTKDKILTGSIMDVLNSTVTKDLVYTISVQGHGGYPAEQIVADPEITIGGILDNAEANAMEYYVNQIHEMDIFIGELIETLSDYPEDVILVMYGDHLPSLGLEAKELKNRSIYQTEYVIWDNMGLNTKDENLKAYQLAASVLKKVNIHTGTMMKFHQERKGTKNYWADLEELQYDMLYGEQYVYNGNFPFLRTKLQLGVKEITISNVVNTLEGDILVTGKNFTAHSQVAINGELVETDYIDTGRLKVKSTELQSGDRVKVTQITDTGKKLGSTKSYDYINVSETLPIGD